MPPEKRACVRAKRVLRALLCDPQEHDWVESCVEEIYTFLDDAKTAEVLSCPCSRCVDGRRRSSPFQSNNETSFWVTRIVSSKRLFALCIIADLPCVVYSFLHHEFSESLFDECVDPIKLRDEVGLSLQDAKSLLHEKEKFFDGGRISFFTYMRSVRTGKEPPSTEEKNWIIDEFLTVSDKLALEPDACERKIPPTATIKDLMIRDSPARPLDRVGQTVDGLGEQAVCMQSLGNLALDLICFIAGGGSYVQNLDKDRASSVDWLKEKDWAALNGTQNFPMVFQLVQIMTCPNEEFGVSKDDHGNDNFKHISQQFHRIWPRHTHEHSPTDAERERHSDATSLSSQGLGSPVNCGYEEIEPARFRSMFVRYQREGHQHKNCRLRVFKSINNDSIQLELLSFDRDALNPSSYYASPTDLRFIPLYAYGNHHGPNEFSARFQLATGSAAILTIPYIFRFQSIEGEFVAAADLLVSLTNGPTDVKLFQTAVTGRVIEKDVVLNESSVVLRKKKRVIGNLIGNGSPQSYHFETGRLQIWRVLDKRALKEILETARMGVHGLKQYPLRAEIAIFFEHSVIVMGIKSVLKLKEFPDSGLRIEIREKATKAALEGRRLCTDDTQYPGLPLFQSRSFSSQDGDGVICDSIELKFPSKEARDDLSQYLDERYNRPPSPARS